MERSRRDILEVAITFVFAPPVVEKVGSQIHPRGCVDVS